MLAFISGDELTLMSIDLYDSVVKKMLPTPTKMHYQFNLRDISKVSHCYNIQLTVKFFPIILVSNNISFSQLFLKLEPWSLNHDRRRNSTRSYFFILFRK